MVALQLGWAATPAGSAEVRATLAAAGERLDLAELYLGLHPAGSAYRLGAILCQQPGGAVCQAFLLDGGSGRWAATPPGGIGSLQDVGPWVHLLDTLPAQGRQPSLLLYMALS